MIKIDLYTKFVLTIIAFSLSVIAYRNIEFIPSANANPVKFAPQASPIDVNIVSIPFYGLDVNVKNTVKAKLDVPYEGIDVNVKNKIEVKSSSYKGLDVNVTNYKDFK